MSHLTNKHTTPPSLFTRRGVHLEAADFLHPSHNPKPAHYHLTSVVRRVFLCCVVIMCILFVHLNPTPKDGEFKVIVAANRDEFFARPSVPAGFWEEDSHILGGRDVTENKGGGTWLAVSKRGKIGIVLNLSGEQSNAEKQGRGFLIADYLKGSTAPPQHMETLKSIAQRYNKFHLVAIQFDRSPVLSHYSNGDDTTEVTTISEGTFAVGNTRLEKPYEKVKKGKTRFEEIVATHNSTKNQGELVESLLSLLKSGEKHKDPTGKEMSHLPEAFREQCCSVFINVPTAGYGTRTHTIILVDSNGKTDFYEWTLKEPIPSNLSDREWISTHQQFSVIS